MQYSPKLKKIMEQIKGILKKNDIAGIVVLHTIEGEPVRAPDGTTQVFGFTEFFNHITPSYSAAVITDTGFSVKGKAKHYPSIEARDKKIASTVNMLEHLSLITGQVAMRIIEMDEGLKKLVEIIKTEGGEPPTSHTQQNN